MSDSSSLEMASLISCSLVRRDKRAPSCWIDWSWAAQLAIWAKFWAFVTAVAAWDARAASVSSSSGSQGCGRS